MGVALLFLGVALLEPAGAAELSTVRADFSRADTDGVTRMQVRMRSSIRSSLRPLSGRIRRAAVLRVARLFVPSRGYSPQTLLDFLQRERGIAARRRK
ncbi:hypothetical protein [Microbacterium sp.]|uniref:hypothetical protein n=1 Tax=Microbacterium sp. TaxID=51671 RepID=UPI0039E2BCC9